MRNLASGIAFIAALDIAFVTSAQSPAVSAGTSVNPDTCFRLRLACEQYPESRKAQAGYQPLRAVIDREEQAVRDVEEEAHRLDARLASPPYRVRAGQH